MQHERGMNCFSISRLEKIPFLIHGFGNRYFNIQSMSKNMQEKKFECVFLNQVHSDIIYTITELPDEDLKGDALLTDRPGIFLIVKTADCLPVLLVDIKQKVIAAVHCGWRGTKKKLIQKTVKKMSAVYNCQKSSLIAGLGPCIGPDCYLVDNDLKESFKHAGLRESSYFKNSAYRDKFYFDLRQANCYQLLKEGIRPENIFSVDLCTYCEEDLFSHRRDQLKAGRMLNFIGMLC